MREGLEKALKITAEEENPVVLLATDGVPTTDHIVGQSVAHAPGLTERFDVVRDLKEIIMAYPVKTAKARDVRVYTVGIYPQTSLLQMALSILSIPIQDADPHFLQRIANETGGAYFHAADSASIRGSLVRLTFPARDLQPVAAWRGTVYPNETKPVARLRVPPMCRELNVCLMYPGSRVTLFLDGPGGRVKEGTTAPGVHAQVMRYPRRGVYTVSVRGDDVPAAGEPCEVLVALPRETMVRVGVGRYGDWAMLVASLLLTLIVRLALRRRSTE
jgi:hypothetical protein